MTSRIVLSHPYSGALYAYFTDQIQGPQRSASAANHDYYKTVYGKHHREYLDRAIMFTMLYDQVFIAPADNAWPDSPSGLRTDGHTELGLNVDWGVYGKIADNEHEIDGYVADPEIKISLDLAKIPCGYPRRHLVTTAVYEYCISRIKQIPIVCSPIREAIIRRLIVLQQPALHALVMPVAQVTVVGDYISITELALSARDLDSLIQLKPDRAIRDHASSFLGLMSRYENDPTQESEEALLRHMLAAMDTEKVANAVSGISRRSSIVLHLLGQHIGSAVSAFGKIGAGLLHERAKWYKLTEEISRFESRAALVKEIEKRLAQLAAKRSGLP
jgi:hypothetical protein